MRAGGVTDADKQASLLDEIEATGRWKSTTILQCARNSDVLAKESGVPSPQGLRSVYAFLNTFV